jgi:dUTP pyrophosphatase
VEPGVRLEVRRLDPSLPLPTYASRGDAGLDLFAAEDASLEPGERAAIPTGIAVAIPEEHAGFVHARSGRALKEGLALVNAPGVIDSGYRGEIKVIVVNLDPRSPIDIRRGDKIAQLVVQPVATVDPVIVDELPSSDRGEGGFGSTGR